MEATPRNRRDSAESTVICTPLSHGDDCTVKRAGCHQKQTRVGVPKATPGSSRRTRGPGTWVLSAPIHHSQKLRGRTSNGKRPSGGRGGVQGRRAPASRTPSRGHTWTHRDTCPQGSLSQTQSRRSSWGPALRAPLLGRHSVQPQGGGCEHRRSRQALPQWVVGVLGALPTPQLLDASPHVGLSEDGSQGCWEDPSPHKTL